MIEFLQDLCLTLKVMIFEWFPTISEAKKSILGPLGDLKSIIGTIATIIAAVVAIAQFMDKYGIETWGKSTPQKPRKTKHSKKP